DAQGSLGTRRGGHHLAIGLQPENDRPCRNNHRIRAACLHFFRSLRLFYSRETDCKQQAIEERRQPAPGGWGNLRNKGNKNNRNQRSNRSSTYAPDQRTTLPRNPAGLDRKSSKQNRKRRRQSTTERDHRGNASAAGTKAHYFRDTALTRRAKYGCCRQQECDAQSETSNCTWHFAEVAYDLGRSNDKD